MKKEPRVGSDTVPGASLWGGGWCRPKVIFQGMKKTYVEAVAAAKGVLRSTITKSFVTSFVPKRLFPLGRLTFRGQIIESSKIQSSEPLPGPSLSWQRLLSTSSRWRSAFSSASPASPSRRPNPHIGDKLSNIATLSLSKKKNANLIQTVKTNF